MYKALIIILMSSNFILCQSKIEIIDTSKTISGFNIEETYPNPYGGATIMRFCVPDTIYAKVTVFSAYKGGNINLGDTVSVIYEGLIKPGWYQATWNGKNANKIRAEFGIYFIGVSCWNRKPSISKSFSGYTKIFLL
jgi:hypothetical protein